MSARARRARGCRRATGALASTCLLALSVTGCPRDSRPEAAESEPSSPSGIVLVDATSGSGFDFVHTSGASAQRLLPETMGSGIAVFDADGDGVADLLLADGTSLGSGGEARRTSGLRLFRNRGGWRFEDSTAASGLDYPGYAMGLAIGDVDGDGALDVLATGLEGERLFRSRGAGAFADVTAEWGLSSRGGGGGESASFGSSAAFFDAEGDGDLDLFAGRYVVWSPAADRPCSPDGVHRVYCTPEGYPATSSRFFRNTDARFVDETESAGFDARGKALGVAVLDHGRDGRLDLAVANDTEPNFLFRGGEGPFVESALELGLALGPSGVARGGMGIAAGDLDGDGREDVVIGNFANEMAALFLADADGLYTDDAARARLGLATLLQLAFGTVIADLDNDGQLDVAFANGHIEPTIGEVSNGRESFAQPLQVFRNTGAGFETSEPQGGLALVGRGLAAGDLDLDGDVDLALSQNGAAAVLLRNDSPSRPWMRVRLRGRRANSWGQGAEIEVEWADGRRALRRLEPSGSYLSSSEPVLTLGLGERGAPARLVVRWPGGAQSVLEAPPVGQEVEVVEPQGDAAPP